ncbi:MAG: glycosyltransferase family 4 protein [bacterium]
MTAAKMRILQVLPALNSGGVERGTVDFAGELVRRGHESLVMSSGGSLVKALEESGSRHLAFPVHRKSLSSLFKVRALRRLLLDLDVDLIHVRSRVPAWMTWLALRKIPAEKRPALVSTFHGLYSVSPYSAIMGCGDQVIAISQCVRDYIGENYPKIDQAKVTVIHRGVDTGQFNRQTQVADDWRNALFADYPQLSGKPLILMPGRITRWKGQLQFIELIEDLVQRDVHCHGVIVGGAQPGKENFLAELENDVRQRGLTEHVTFLGHRTDIANLYRIASVVCNLSQHAEPFGRTVIESLAVGTPVVSYDYGGPAESLKDCLPQGLVPLGDRQALLDTVGSFLAHRPTFALPENFTLDYQAAATLGVYEKALANNIKFQRRTSAV